MSLKSHKKLKSAALVSAVLGVVSFLWLLVDYFALTDIWHDQESDVQQEWLAVALSFIPIVLFYLSVFMTLYFVFRVTHKKIS